MQTPIIIIIIFTDYLTFVKYIYEVSNELKMKRCFRSSVWWSLTVANIYLLRKKFVDLHSHNTSLTTLYLYFNQFAPEPAARNRPCGSTSFVPLVTSSVWMAKDKFVR